MRIHACMLGWCLNSAEASVQPSKIWTLRSYILEYGCSAQGETLHATSSLYHIRRSPVT